MTEIKIHGPEISTFKLFWQNFLSSMKIQCMELSMTAIRNKLVEYGATLDISQGYIVVNFEDDQMAEIFLLTYS